ncbi:MAG TPA: hypothetical protein VI894_03635 [Candidatus Nanoarchaeia archaeon]|nr:hypothetical protein [Candidatus Nanoarchaeia archaeon]
MEGIKDMNLLTEEKIFLFFAVRSAELIVKNYEKGENEEALRLLKEHVQCNTVFSAEKTVLSALKILNNEIVEEFKEEIEKHRLNGGNQPAFSGLSGYLEAYFGSIFYWRQN